MTKKEVKKSPCVSMRYFLEKYYGIGEDYAYKLGIHSHKVLKQVANLYGVKLKKIPFDNLDKDMIARGEVILVEDIYGNRAPYINPNIILIDEFETTMDERFISYEIKGDEINDKYKGRQKSKHFKS